MPIKKIVSLIVVVALAILTCEIWLEGKGYQTGLDTVASEAANFIEPPLSPQSIFQEKYTDNSTGELKGSVLEDLKFLTVIFSIGTYVFLDRAPMRKLERAMRFKFSGNNDFLTGVDLRDVTFEDDVVRIPYQRNGKSYMVNICLRDRVFDADRETVTESNVLKGFEIQVFEIPDALLVTP